MDISREINVYIWFIQVIQIPFILLLVLLFFQAIRLLKINALKWVFAAFIFNLIYVVLKIASDPDSPFSLKYIPEYISFYITLIDIISTFCFFLAGINYYYELRRSYFIDQQKRIEVFQYRNIVIVFLSILTGNLIYVSSIVNSSQETNIPYGNIFLSVYGLLGLTFSGIAIYHSAIRYKAKFLFLGFFLWALLQILLMFHPNSIHQANIITLSGFTGSLLSKFSILLGISLWYVEFSKESVRKLETAKQEKEQFRKSSKYFESILSKTFHEINMPLKNLGYTIDELSENIPRDSRQKINILENDYERVKAIVAASKEAYNKDSNSVWIEFSPALYNPELKVVSLNKLIEIAIRSCKKDLDRISFYPEYGSKCFIECIQFEIIQVFINLFKNAFESYNAFSGEKKIYIRTYVESSRFEKEKRSVIAEVEDYGSGISPEIMKDIWNEGYSTKIKDEKNIVRGQGLFIVKQILSKHPEAEINVESLISNDPIKVSNKTKFTVKFRQEKETN